MAWSVDPASEVPASRQLVEAVLDALARGEFSSGEQLPSVRGMAAEALVNHNTVARAYLELEHLGAVRGQSGRGVFVTPEGPALARAARRAATLERFRRAADGALGAGHAVHDLQRILAERDERRESA